MPYRKRRRAKHASCASRPPTAQTWSSPILGDLYSAPLSGERHAVLPPTRESRFSRNSPRREKRGVHGKYDGNTEVYLIPADGGEPKRLTFTSTNSRDDLGDRMPNNNIVVAWTPDGSEIVYRNRIGDGFDGKLAGRSPRRDALADTAARRGLRKFLSRRQEDGLQQGDARVPHVEVLSRRYGRRRPDLRPRGEDRRQHHR